MTPKADEPKPEALELHDIAAVARLTGLSSANLRMWEQRYGVVCPTRSDSGRRQYSETDLRRLTLLKNLSDRGHPIRKTAGLELAALEQMLLEATAKTDDDKLRRTGEGCRVVIAGDRLAAMLGEQSDRSLRGVSVVARVRNIEDVEEAVIPGDVDLLLVECPALFEDMVKRVQRLIDRLNAVRAIVVYMYSQSKTLESTEKGLSRITAIRAPVTATELRAACATDIALANRAAHALLEQAPEPRSAEEKVPERQFSDEHLARIAQISSAIECECPNHLAGLLANLNGFEKYSAECTNRNAADAEMHAYLHRMTAAARATMEDALKVLVEFEGINVD